MGFATQRDRTVALGPLERSRPRFVLCNSCWSQFWFPYCISSCVPRLFTVESSKPEKMSRCKHTVWLSLCSGGGPDADLLLTDRVQTVISHIPSPDTKYPSFMVLMGNQTKGLALRELFGIKRDRQTTRDSHDLHLHVDPSSVFGTPSILAESGFPDCLPGRTLVEHCHETKRLAFKQDLNSRHLRADTLYSQVLLPFADVFCFFCDDPSDFEHAAKVLCLFTQRSHSLELPDFRPRVVIVTGTKPAGQNSEHCIRNILLSLLKRELSKDPFDFLCTIEVVNLAPHEELSGKARFRPLKERLLRLSSQARLDRQDHRMLFSAIHLGELLANACEHITKSQDPFSFIKSSRTYNPVPEDLNVHFCNLLKHIKSPSSLVNFAASTIASSLLLDQYPPDAHRKSNRPAA